MDTREKKKTNHGTRTFVVMNHTFGSFGDPKEDTTRWIMTETRGSTRRDRGRQKRRIGLARTSSEPQRRRQAYTSDEAPVHVHSTAVNSLASTVSKSVAEGYVGRRGLQAMQSCAPRMNHRLNGPRCCDSEPAYSGTTDANQPSIRREDDSFIPRGRTERRPAPPSLHFIHTPRTWTSFTSPHEPHALGISPQPPLCSTDASLSSSHLEAKALHHGGLATTTASTSTKGHLGNKHTRGGRRYALDASHAPQEDDGRPTAVTAVYLHRFAPGLRLGTSPGASAIEATPATRDPRKLRRGLGARGLQA